MEQLFFILENYHYVVALYGYYKVASITYDNIEKGYKLYNFCSNVLTKTPSKNEKQPEEEYVTKFKINDKDEWAEIETLMNETYDKDSHQTDFELLSHTSHTSDSHMESSDHSHS